MTGQPPALEKCIVTLAKALTMCTPAAAAKEQAAGQLLCKEFEPGPSGVGGRGQEL